MSEGTNSYFGFGNISIHSCNDLNEDGNCNICSDGKIVKKLYKKLKSQAKSIWISNV